MELTQNPYKTQFVTAIIDKIFLNERLATTFIIKAANKMGNEEKVKHPETQYSKGCQGICK